MTDPLSKAERSTRMSKVRGSGNKSTEGRVEVALLEAGIEGWEKQPKDVLGKPDFYFRHYKLALFVDGCFWHSCPRCKRRIPINQHDFWKQKLDVNRRRDNRVHRLLRQQGYHVMRIWEHDLKKNTWLRRLKNMLNKINDSPHEP
jgi:DNA mismatch endonuclease (patch repair protein)